VYHQSHVVDLIERASDARPFCPCGRHTTPVWRDGTVWLECASLSDAHEGIIARLLAAASAPVHIKSPIIDVPADGSRLAA
jgi:hypothetical protein